MHSIVKNKPSQTNILKQCTVSKLASPTTTTTVPADLDLSINTYSDRITHSSPATKPSKSKKQKVDDDDAFFNQLKKMNSSMIDIVKEKPPQPQVDDEATSFCKSLIIPMKELPTKKLRLAKIKINELLYKLEYGDDLDDE